MTRPYESTDLRKTNDRRRGHRRPVKCWLPRVDTVADGMQVGFVLGNIVGFVTLAIAMIVMGVMQ